MDYFLDRQADIKITEKGALPHWHQNGKIQYVTFRLADSMPQSVIEHTVALIASFKEQNPEPWSAETMLRFRNLVGRKKEQLLDNGYGSCILACKDIRAIVSSAIHYFDGVRYNLIAYVIMPNHIHMLFCPLEGFETSKILQVLKSYTAHRIKAVREIKGPVWMRENYDRIVRSEDELKHHLAYIKSNPRHLTSDLFDLYI